MMRTCGGDADLPGRGPDRRIETRRTTDGVDSEDRGIAFSSPLNRQLDEVRGAKIEGLPLPELPHQPTLLAVPLQWMWGGLLYLPRPGLQKVRPHHVASQRAP